VKEKSGIAILVGFIFACALLVACQKNVSTLGSVNLKPSGESTLAVKISNNSEQAWQLRFSSPVLEANELPLSDRVKIYLKNDDTRPLVIYLKSNGLDLIIEPKATGQIFDGTLGEMLLAGRTEYADLIVRTSRERPVNATFKFVRESGKEDVTIEVSTWFLHYSM
jgi:hypothetical protein